MLAENRYNPEIDVMHFQAKKIVLDLYLTGDIHTGTFISFSTYAYERI